jgi:vancomycin aglycone glucosyltransferase
LCKDKYDHLPARLHEVLHRGTAPVIIPHNYDQFYWAHRVKQLGIGVSGPLRDELSVESLGKALRECLQPEVSSRAREVASRMELHGARIAAERIVNKFGS